MFHVKHINHFHADNGSNRHPFQVSLQGRFKRRFGKFAPTTYSLDSFIRPTIPFQRANSSLTYFLKMKGTLLFFSHSKPKSFIINI